MMYILIAVVVVFLLLALAIATYSGAQLEDTYEKYNRIPCNKKMTGGDFALYLTNNIFDCKINVARTSGQLKDAYSSRSKMVVLSESTCDVASVAALTIVAHEFGHAEQDLHNSKRLKSHKSLNKAIKILGYLMFPLVVIGVFFCLIFPNLYAIGLTFVGVSLAIFLLALFLKLSTIPLEKDASKRALRLLKETDALDVEELIMAKDLLKAALMTYVGDFLRAILWWTFLTKKTKLF